MDHRRLRKSRHRRKLLERFGLLGSLAGVLLLAWLFARLAR